MTEAPKGLMTSKELGMAVADRLLQAEKRETPGSKPTDKQQALMRRRLQAPTTEPRVDRQVALEQLQQGGKELAHLKSQPFERLWVKPTVTDEWGEIDERIWVRDGGTPRGEDPWSRKNTDEFRAKVYGLPPMTDEQWKEFEKIETTPVAELLPEFAVHRHPQKAEPLCLQGRADEKARNS